MTHDQIISPWARSEQQVLEALGSDREQGLSAPEADKRLAKYGLNILKADKKISALQRFWSQLSSPVVITLLIVALISFLLGEFIDSIAIVSIVIINALIAFFQETKAEAAIEALKALSAPKARVLRGGNIFEINGNEVCLGDILVLEAGDYVAADARIIQANQLSCDEGILTGESLPVNKEPRSIPEEAAVAERRNMLFAGTALATGSAKAVVTAIGMNTEMGRIAELLEVSERAPTPLQQRLEQVSKKLLFFCGIVVLLVSLLGFLHGEKVLDVLMTGISLAVAAIPEGLPTVVTLALALAVHRMAKRNAIVRHLPSVETLGSTDVICTDKTGTLTTGKMGVREIFALETGVKEASGESGDRFQSAAEGFALCSNASVVEKENGEVIATGDPTEIALLLFAKQQGVNLRQLNIENPRLAEWSFDSNRKRMSVAVQNGNRVVIQCKGAPEAIIPLCNLNLEERKKVEAATESLSAKGRRLLALATKTLKEDPNGFNVSLFREPSTVELGLTFAGLVAISDPPRKESRGAIEECKKAGIKVVMITGDHPITAKAIASELGIVEPKTFDQVLTGSELNQLSDADLERRVEEVSVYARVSPEHKLKIVRAWKNRGHIVAMTGDGVNDAPALKEASIGIAMGKGGTEVARQASSVILTDDHFATIVSAVEEGRAIYGNILRTIQYLLSGNLAEILIMLGAAILGWPMPLAPIHLLWINLVTDGLPSLALAAEPVPQNVLKLTKRPSPTGFFSAKFYSEMALVGVIVSIMALAVYGYHLKTNNELMARTQVFSFLVFAELFRSFSCRSDRQTFFQMGLTSNVYHLVAVAIPIVFQLWLHHSPLFQKVFKVGSVEWSECFLMIAMTLIPVSAIEIKKWLEQKQKTGQGARADL